MKREREPGEIESLLRRRYPDHPHLERTIQRLERVPCLSWEDVRRSSEDPRKRNDLLRILPPLFQYLLGLVERFYSAATWGMGLSCTVMEVTLRPENKIEPLPTAYSPMYEESEPEDTEPEDTEDVPKEVIIDGNYVPNDGDYQILEQPVDDGAGFKLTMLDFEGSPSLNAIWGKTSKPRILERKCYAEIWRSLDETWHTLGSRWSFLLLGIPGVGKTAFLIYTLFKLMGLRKTVVFQTKAGDRYLYVPGEDDTDDYNCSEIDPASRTILLDPLVYYLVDDKLPNPPLFGGRALVACTPLQTNYKEYKKDGRVKEIYVPVWSADEIALAWQEVFNNESERGRLTLDFVKRRYQEWGGTARFVLEKPDEDLHRILEGVTNVQKTVEAVGRLMADGEHLSHKIVHMQVEKKYRDYRYMFASPFVTDLALKKLQGSQEGELKLFLSFKGLAAHGLNGLKGGVLQSLFKSKAQGIWNLKVRAVSADKNDGKEEVCTFNFGVQFDGFKDLKTFQVPVPAERCNKMFWPSSPVQATFDAFKVAQGRIPGEDILEMYQVTISSGSRQHGLKYAAALELMKLFRIPARRTRVYIVTTSELFPEAGFQDWRKARNMVFKDKRILKQLDGIQQFVLDSGF